MKIKSHSPIPWRVFIDEENEVQGIVDARERTIIETDSGFYPPKIEDAEFIVKACNSYKALLIACEYGVGYFSAMVKVEKKGQEMLEVFNKAIAEADK